MPRAPQMVPLEYHSPAGTWYFEYLIRREAQTVGLLALRHALAYQLPGVWGDHDMVPNSLLLVREGNGELEAFGWGRPTPAVRWLVRLGLPTALVAPTPWHRALNAVMKIHMVSRVETWMPAAPPEPKAAPTAATRRLTLDDAGAFAASAPSWALQGWVSFPSLIAHGAAFGVPHGNGFAALAWIFDQTVCYDSVAVYTAPRFRRLGLARAAADALLRHVRGDRNKLPLWSTTLENSSSRALARSFGFAPKTEETILRWPAHGGGRRVGGTETCPQMTQMDTN